MKYRATVHDKILFLNINIALQSWAFLPRLIIFHILLIWPVLMPVIYLCWKRSFSWEVFHELLTIEIGFILLWIKTIGFSFQMFDTSATLEAKDNCHVTGHASRSRQHSIPPGKQSNNVNAEQNDSGLWALELRWVSRKSLLQNYIKDNTKSQFAKNYMYWVLNSHFKDNYYGKSRLLKSFSLSHYFTFHAK